MSPMAQKTCPAVHRPIPEAPEVALKLLLIHFDCDCSHQIGYSAGDEPEVQSSCPPDTWLLTLHRQLACLPHPRLLLPLTSHQELLGENFQSDMAVWLLFQSQQDPGHRKLGEG